MLWIWKILKFVVWERIKASKGEKKKSNLCISRSKTEKFDLLEEYKKRQTGKDMINLVVIGKYSCIVVNIIFNSISDVSRQPVHLSKLSWSSFNQYTAQYSFQATGCFPT